MQKSSSEKESRPVGARQDRDLAYDGAGVKDPQGSPSVPEPPCDGMHQPPAPFDDASPGGEGWRLVERRRRRLDQLDRRSLIVWDLRTDADPGRFAALLRTKATCWWRGRATNRHMVVEFATELAFKAYEQVTREACKQLGVKVANETRGWQLRQLHRNPAPVSLPANRYVLIAHESRTQRDLRVKAWERERRRKEARRLMPPPPPRSPRASSSPISSGNASFKKLRPVAGSKRSERRTAKAKLGERLAKNGNIRVGSLNVQGGMVNDIAEYENYAAKKEYDVLAIQECRLAPTIKLAAKGFKIIRQEPELEDAEHGVLFLVANHLATGVTREKSTAPNQL